MPEVAEGANAATLEFGGEPVAHESGLEHAPLEEQRRHGPDDRDLVEQVLVDGLHERELEQRRPDLVTGDARRDQCRDDRAGRGARCPLEMEVAIEPRNGAREPDALDAPALQHDVCLFFHVVSLTRRAGACSSATARQ